MTRRFRFGLQPALDHRERIRDERARELAEKQRDLTDAQTAADALETTRLGQRETLMRDHARIDVDTLRASYAHLAFLDRSIEEQAVCIAACMAEVQRAQARLLDANTQRQALETLKLRRLEAFVADAAHIEQRDTDDQNARRYGRAHNLRGNAS